MIIGFCSAKGGVGKSSLGTGFAWELMSRGDKVLLVDADPRNGSCLEAGELSQAAGRPAPTIVAMGPDMHRSEQLPRLAKQFDSIIIDTPGRADEIQRSAMMVSDVVVIPISPGRFDFRALQLTLGALGEAQVIRPSLRGAVVLTRLTRRTHLAEQAKDALKQAGVPLLKAVTHHRVAWAEANNEGLGVAQYAPKSQAANELRAILAEVTRSKSNRRQRQ